MKKILYISLFCAVFYFSWLFWGGQNIYDYQKISIIKNAKNFIASVFFADSTTTEALKEHYSVAEKTKNKIKLLIVAGHDDESGGTEFRGVKEAKINLDLALNLAEFFKSNDKFEVTLVRDKNGYNRIFSDYFGKERESIKEFSGFYSQGETKSAEDVGYNIDTLREIFEDFFVNNRTDEPIETILDRALDRVDEKGGITRDGKYKSVAIKKRVLKDHFLDFFKSFSTEIGNGEGEVIDLQAWKRWNNR